jgi:hypothetical protein
MIRQAFQNTPAVGVQVNISLGHYDLVTRRDVTVLPQTWEASIEPGMSITMYMWPMPPMPSLPPMPEVPLMADFYSPPPLPDISAERRRQQRYAAPASLAPNID